MAKRVRTPMASPTDYSMSVGRRDVIGTVRRQDKGREERVQKGSPPVPESASGIQVVHSYAPPQNELDYILRLRSDAEKRLIGRETVEQIEAVQLRKVTSGEIHAPAGELEYARRRAAEYDVDLVF